MTKRKPLPEMGKCPWCGRRSGELNADHWGTGEHYFVLCNIEACSSAGPNKKSTRGAIQAWNRVGGMVHGEGKGSE